jgi:quercetin dioxygenase-like cupin family protein
MTRTTALRLALAGAAAWGAMSTSASFAQERRDIYVPSARMERLSQREVPDQQAVVTIDRYTLSTGYVGGRHYHSGPVTVYVLEGAFTIDEDGKPRRTFRAGATYEEPVGTPMQARNLSADEPTQILVVQVTKPGEPMMYRAD